MWSNSIHHLVADTRFMSEDALRNFFVSLVNCTEVGGNDPRLGEDTVASSVDIASVHADDNVTARNNVVTFFGAVTEIVCAGDSVSKASVAWYEMLLVEVALRNRDRFGSLWPILSQHYARTLSEKQTHLSYVIERYAFLFDVSMQLTTICLSQARRGHAQDCHPYDFPRHFLWGNP